MEFVPAFVDSWDGKEIRVFITGYTDGADIGMKAELMFPFSDRPDYTGFHIEKGDPVWVVFNGGDPNQPIVTGYRHFNTGENAPTRRWRHVNIETHATEHCLNTSNNHDIQAKTKLAMQSPTVTVDSEQTTIKGSSQVTIEAPTIVLKGNIQLIGNISGSGGNSSFDGSMEVSGTVKASDCISGGISGKNHVHGGSPKPSN